MKNASLFGGRTVAIGLLIGVGVAALLVTAFRPRPVSVDLAAIAEAAMRVTIDEEGRTRVREVFAVSAPVAGRVLRSPLQAGDPVVAGRTVVAVIEETVPLLLDARARREIDAQMAAAAAAVALGEAEVRQAEAELIFAEREFSRAQKLARTNVIAERTLERARLDMDAKSALVARAKAGLDVRRRELDIVRAKLTGPQLDPALATRDESACCVSVLAPASGRVLRRLHESEKILPAGMTLLEIGDIADIEIMTDLLSTDAVKVREGAPAAIDAWGGGSTLQARVRRVEPSGFTKTSALGIEEQRVRVVLDILTSIGERAGLGHDYRVLVKIETWAAPAVLTVPLSALFRRGDAWAVFVFENGRARTRLLRVGHRNNTVAEVVEGLAAGERVILHPSDKVGEATRIAPRQASEIGTGPSPPPKRQPIAAFGRP